jgi:hypothetical protein
VSGGKINRRGIGEVPMDLTSHEQLRRFLIDIRQTVVDLRGPTTPPTAPTNFKVTPLAVAVLLQWTRGLNADGTEVLWNTSTSLSGATVIDAGSGNQHVDYVSNSTQKRFYWVRSYDAHSTSRSIEAGPLAATPMASGSSVTPPTPPVAGQGTTTDTTTGRTVDRYNPHVRGQQ